MGSGKACPRARRAKRFNSQPRGTTHPAGAMVALQNLAGGFCCGGVGCLFCFLPPGMIGSGLPPATRPPAPALVSRPAVVTGFSGFDGAASNPRPTLRLQRSCSAGPGVLNHRCSAVLYPNSAGTIRGPNPPPPPAPGTGRAENNALAKRSGGEGLGGWAWKTRRGICGMHNQQAPGSRLCLEPGNVPACPPCPDGVTKPSPVFSLVSWRRTHPKAPP